jgi:hypothetical protein
MGETAEISIATKVGLFSAPFPFSDAENDIDSLGLCQKRKCFKYPQHR